MRLSDKERQRLRSAVLSSGPASGHVLAVRSAKTNLAVDSERRDQLLADVRDGKHVEIVLDVLAFEQKIGAPNRSFLSFRHGVISKLARSAAGMPFLRDHDQGNALARAGTILAAEHKKLDEGHYQIHETVQLTAPWAVELALRGLLSSVSIGWHPESVICSACETPVLEGCYHLPGDRLSADGAPVEWITTDGVMTETSIVNVPAVSSARIEEVRASLSAALGTEHASAFMARKAGSMFERLARVLGAQNATEEDIFRRAETVLSELQIANRDRDVAREELRTVHAELGVLRAEAARGQRDEFLRSGVAEGKLTPADREVWGGLYDANPARARELLAARAPHSVTPVGAALQSAAKEAPAAAPGSEVDPAISAKVLATIRNFGLSESDAKKLVASQANVIAAGEA
jgi:hypothetical protein